MSLLFEKILVPTGTSRDFHGHLTSDERRQLFTYMICIYRLYANFPKIIFVLILRQMTDIQFIGTRDDCEVTEYISGNEYPTACHYVKYWLENPQIHIHNPLIVGRSEFGSNSIGLMLLITLGSKYIDFAKKIFGDTPVARKIGKPVLRCGSRDEPLFTAIAPNGIELQPSVEMVTSYLHAVQLNPADYILHKSYSEFDIIRTGGDMILGIVISDEEMQKIESIHIMHGPKYCESIPIDLSRPISIRSIEDNPLCPDYNHYQYLTRETYEKSCVTRQLYSLKVGLMMYSAARNYKWAINPKPNVDKVSFDVAWSFINPELHESL